MDIVNLQTRSFIAIVEHGSITAAADAVGLAKSGVSAHLRQLEDRLGVRLLARTTRKQSLTPIGVQYFQRCKEIQQLSQHAVEEVGDYLEEPSGRLRITAPYAFIKSKIAPAIGSLVRSYPKIRPELIIEDHRLDLVENRIDVAITVGELPDSDYRAQRVDELIDVLCIAPTYLKQEGLKSSALNRPQAICNWRYIAHKWQGVNVKHPLVHVRTKKKVTLSFDPIAYANNLTAILALAREGVGLALLPKFVVEADLANGTLLHVLPAFEANRATVYAVHPFGAFPPISVRKFIETVKATL